MMAIKIAILDLYEGTANEGMRSIRTLIEELIVDFHRPLKYDVFETRLTGEVPDLTYDAFISSGGPGSPLDSAGSYWESKYFGLMDAIHAHNHANPDQKKHVLLICHSFQIYTRYYGYGLVSKRKSTSFGVMPMHKTFEGHHDPLLRSLGDPFWAVDSRDYQITKPNIEKIQASGGAVLCVEKYRPNVKLERAVMAVRFDEAFFGTQFHPEADAVGMHKYLLRDDKKALVIEKHGEKKYWEMLDHLNDPDKIMLTNRAVVPRFLMMALQHRLNSVSA
ncbi:MAG: GMP synthase [Cyclobacteriaceae bacterium]|nr:GMP synthase [Cyclobacteriaceae bacterium]